MLAWVSALLLVSGFALRTRPCTAPNCGEFYGFVAETEKAGNCTINKVLGNGVSEYSGPTTVCADSAISGAPTNGQAVSCMDGGYRTGNESFIYFTSGSGQFIHRFFLSKEADPVHVIAASLPKSYDFIVGMQHVPWGPSGRLYVITTTMLYVVPSTSSTPGAPPIINAILDLKNLSLSQNCLVTANMTQESIHVVDVSQKRLHTISLKSSPPIKSISLTSTDVNVADITIAQIMGNAEGPVGLIGITANPPVKMVKIDTDTGVVSDLYDFPSNATKIVHTSSVEMGVILHFCDADTVYTAYVDDSPVDFGLSAPFAFSVRGDIHMFE